MKKGLLLIVSLFAFAITAQADILLEQQLAGCEKIGYPQWRDDCYESIPAKAQNYAICLKLSSPERKKECFRNHPPESQADCLLNQTSDLLDACLLELKETTGDSSLCKKIENRNSRRNCYTCNSTASSPEAKSACLAYWANQTQDKTICDLIDQTASRNACLSDMSLAKVEGCGGSLSFFDFQQCQQSAKQMNVKAKPEKVKKVKAAPVKPPVVKVSKPRKLTGEDLKQAQELSAQIKAEKMEEQKRAQAAAISMSETRSEDSEVRMVEAAESVPLTAAVMDEQPEVNRLKGMDEAKADEKAVKAKRAQEAREAQAREKAAAKEAKAQAKAAKIQEKLDAKEARILEKAQLRQSKLDEKEAKAEEKAARAQAKADEKAAKLQQAQEAKQAKAEEKAARAKAKADEKAAKLQQVQEAKQAKADEKAARIQSKLDEKEAKAQAKAERIQSKKEAHEAKAQAKVEAAQQEREAHEERISKRKRDIEQAREALVMTPVEDWNQEAVDKSDSDSREASVDAALQPQGDVPAEEEKAADPKIELMTSGCAIGFGTWSEPPQKKKDEIACDQSNVEQFAELLNRCASSYSPNPGIKLFDMNKDGCVTCDDLKAWRTQAKKLYKAKKRSTDGDALDLKQCRDRKF